MPRLKPRRVGSGRYLYRGHIIERLDPIEPGERARWWFSTEHPDGVESLQFACILIDNQISDGFIHAGEGPGW